jgi:hypothetical protein
MGKISSQRRKGAKKERGSELCIFAPLREK